ncbi:MAG: transcription-repair coupling factor [Candidatus Nanopelagicales bacterium]
MRGLLSVYEKDPQLSSALDSLSKNSAQEALSGPQSAQAIVTALLASPDFGGRRLLVVTPGTHEAEDLLDELESYLDPAHVTELPAWETLPHERLSPSREIVGRRFKALTSLTDPASQVVVAGVRALLQPMIKGLMGIEPVIVTQGQDCALEDLVDRLAYLGYERTDLVARRGEFAVRGGIVDVFSPTDELPVRVEFFGDEVEAIRHFSVTDQRSLATAEQGLWAPPVRELLLSDDVKSRSADLAAKHPELADVFDQVVQGIYVEGMESLAPLLSDGMTTVLEQLAAANNESDKPLVLVLQPEKVAKRAEDLLDTSQEFLDASWRTAAEGGSAPIDLAAASFVPLADMAQLANELELPWWTYSSLGALEAENPFDSVSQLTTLPPSAHDQQGALDLIADRVAQHSRVVVAAAGVGSVQRIAEQLRELDLPAQIAESIDAAPQAGSLLITKAVVASGVDARELDLLLLSESDLAGRRVQATRSKSTMPTRRKRAIDPLSLQPGDFVVHEKHGVGKFVALEQRTHQGQTREYVVLEYAVSKRGQPPDRLFVPSDQLDQVTRYVGGEAPGLHKLGGSDWANTKKKARKAVKEIAGELVRLYAARQAASGRQFGPDTPWQNELEDAFPFVETRDQLASIDEVKADMEKSMPMDRIVCGDVGYGKTEIAVRAAFKAVQDGAQVAVLVPTTLLVRQHFQTFSERFAPFPIRVEALSRFQTAAEAKAILEGLADGTVDVVIATHRILSPKTRFKDLGLVIVDEEQRFGVEHKEHLKALRTNVDILSMSATPIPRTLEMAVTGIREMSVIQTPPEQRLPVLTYVGAYNKSQVKAAISRELLRDGQVFFIHNRVQSIDKVATELQELVPDARIAVAHGRMSEKALEETIDQFWNREIDVLVCTTIVENGLDISNANTLIVDRADQLGLSQLHQLRGRVGRGRDRAYAYFFYPSNDNLSETAHDRLATIAQNTDLGSGMAVAMKDLEIRGAGNLLGAEQAGHIANVGFDLYVRLVGEALSRVKGDADEGVTEVSIELPTDSHIPTSYVAEERLRLEAYKRLAAAGNSDEINEVREELVDRYGPMPEPVLTLFEVAELRSLAREAGLTEIVAQGSRIRLAPVELPESRTLRLTRLYPGATLKPATRTLLVPAPKTESVGGQPLVNHELIAWVATLIREVLL